jgi:hypothetical protein
MCRWLAPSSGNPSTSSSRPGHGQCPWFPSIQSPTCKTRKSITIDLQEVHYGTMVEFWSVSCNSVDLIGQLVGLQGPQKSIEHGSVCKTSSTSDHSQPRWVYPAIQDQMTSRPLRSKRPFDIVELLQQNNQHALASKTCRKGGALTGKI